MARDPSGQNPFADNPPKLFKTTLRSGLHRLSNKVQLVRFKRKADAQWECGLAFLKDFGVHTVEFIVDGQGKRLKGAVALHDFLLQEGPLCYIDDNYQERM